MKEAATKKEVLRGAESGQSCQRKPCEEAQARPDGYENTGYGKLYFAGWENTVYVKRYSPGILFPGSTDEKTQFPIDRREIWRYAGMKNRQAEKQTLTQTENPNDTEEETVLEALLEEVILEAGPILEAKVCYRILPLVPQIEEEILPFIRQSENLTRLLEGCRETVLFAATIGMKFDLLLRKTQRISPAKGLLLQAFGTERVEALCDAFCKEIREKAKMDGNEITTRYSPGYGDLPLEVQSDFFRLLDCSRQIGVSVTRQYLMTPEKSVTAIFGIRKPYEARNKGGISDCLRDYATGIHSEKCMRCLKIDCLYRGI